MLRHMAHNDSGTFRIHAFGAERACRHGLGSRSRCNTYAIRRRCMRVPKRQERSRFWELVRTGAGQAEAGRGAGVTATSAQRWFRQAGGVPPPNSPEPTSSRNLSISEREEIFAGVERGESIRRIAKLLRRAPSPVLRDMRRNMYHQLYRARSRLRAAPAGPHRTRPWRYRPSRAHERANRRSSLPRTATLPKSYALRYSVYARETSK